MRGEEIIGGVIYSDFNGVNVNMHCAGGDGWLSRYALWCFFDYPFNRMKAKRATALIGERNEKSQLLAEALGFRLETTLSGADPTGDLLVYVLRQKDCRWLKVNYEQKMAA